MRVGPLPTGIAPQQPQAPEPVEAAELKVHRRLPLGFTFLLAAIHGLDVRLGTTVSVQGLVLDFNHPWLLIVSAWAAWAWSLWRYWQHERLYSSTAFEFARRQAQNAGAFAALFAPVRSEVEAGKYTEHGLEPGEAFSIGTRFGTPVVTPSENSEGGWDFPELDIWVAPSAPDAAHISRATRLQPTRMP